MIDINLGVNQYLLCRASENGHYADRDEKREFFIHNLILLGENELISNAIIGLFWLIERDRIFFIIIYYRISDIFLAQNTNFIGSM